MNNIIPSTGKTPRTLVPQSSPHLPAKAQRPKHTPATAPPLEPAVINIPAATNSSPDPEAVPALPAMDDATDPQAVPALTEMADTTDPDAVPALTEIDYTTDPDAVPALSVIDAAESPLTPPQRTALVALVGGMSQIEAANEAGVSRWTLHRWLRDDTDFQAAFNAWQQDALATAQNQLRAAMQEAVSTVLDAIERRNDANLAWKLLQSQGATAPPRPGASDAAELKRQQALERKRQRIAERREHEALNLSASLTPSYEEVSDEKAEHHGGF